MHLKITRSSWSEHDWDDSRRYKDDPDQIAPLKLGPVEEAPRFFIDEIGPDWVRVKYSSGESVSHGTFDKECNGPGSGKLTYPLEKTIKVGESVELSFSERFSESAYGSSVGLWLVEAPAIERSWSVLEVNENGSNERITIPREFIEEGRTLNDSYTMAGGKPRNCLNIAPIAVTDREIRFKGEYGGVDVIEGYGGRYVKGDDGRSRMTYFRMTKPKDVICFSGSDNQLHRVTVTAGLWERYADDPEAREKLAKELNEQNPEAAKSLGL